MNYLEIKIELLKLGKKQSDLLPELRKLGHKVCPADISSYLSGNIQTPKSKLVLEDAEKIIAKWGEENNEE